MASKGRPRNPSRVKSALVLVDVINAFDFNGGNALRKHALPAARRLAALKKKAQSLGRPVIYANDNFSQWQSDFPRLFKWIVESTHGDEIARILEPGAHDYFILKPKHSAFYLTPLELLLNNLGVRKIILGGFQTDMCVLLTAHDAHMRNFSLYIPSNCSASEKPENHRWAMRHVREFLEADTRPYASTQRL
ncbi:MAG: cysteine hydrolase [Candidatus Hydrogenedentes bacterium]|nr:cysteine hydrolase [Candidatus Hydrogenedentota bacterium]